VKTPDDRRKELPWLTDNSIPAANPADLKTLWKLQNDLEAIRLAGRDYGDWILTSRVF
jgi:hypothetical protein